MDQYRKLGSAGPLVSAIAYGAMGVEGDYGLTDENNAIALINDALNAGCSFIDTADAYGNGHNEQLLNRAIVHRRRKAFIATKFGVVFDSNEMGTQIPTEWGISLSINGKPKYAKACLENSLERLGTDHIDLWYLHYPDPSIPIEETVGAMSQAVEQGKVRFLGLCNVSSEQVRRAHKVHRISAVQNQYSLWRREAEKNLLPVLRELDIALVAWSPLGGGLLTSSIEKLSPDNSEIIDPRCRAEKLMPSQKRFTPLLRLADKLKITAPQLAIAWLLHQGHDIIPVPVTRTNEHLMENVKATEILLKPDMVKKIDELTLRELPQGQMKL
ncbi:MAG: aldo/keto reductase [Desulfobacteraceae bacterium]|nr:aldo/keto reductase [Desulfobacteraceae bacterium]